MANAADDAALRAELQQLRDAVRVLQEEVRTLKAERAAAPAPSPVIAPIPPQAAVAPVRETERESLATTSVAGVEPSPLPARQSVSDNAAAVSRIDNQAPPTDPELKGFLALPGTQTLFRLGGYAKLDAIFDTRDAGNADQFVTAAIPVPRARRDGRNFNLHARQTRFTFEVRRPSVVGENLRFYLENDFYGGDGGQYDFHLRQAFGQLGNTYGGYGYSSFMDADALPDTLDFAGPGGQVFVLQPGVHHAFRLNASSSLTLAAERSSSEVRAAGGSVDGTQHAPDLVVAARTEHDWGHLQAGALLRRIGYTDDARDDATTGGGIAVSGALNAARRGNADLLMFGAVAGKGVARYVSDTSGSALDAAVDADGRLHALRAFGAYAGYTHYWNTDWRSNLVYGIARVDASPLAGGDAFRRSAYAAANLIWSPAPTLTMGVELLHGRLELQNGNRNDATRVQGSLQYSFVK